MSNETTKPTKDSGIFGLPYSEANSQLVILPVPWEVTTSYGGGTSRGPSSVLAASPQLDLYDLGFGNQYKRGIFLRDEAPELCSLNDELKPLAQTVIECREANQELTPALQKTLDKINLGCQQMTDWVEQQAEQALKAGKLACVLGGDHSSPLGLIKALSDKHSDGFGILHIDAHADLRDAYQGFEQSHASIFHNVLKQTPDQVTLTQIGIRDFCEEEFQLAKNNPRVTTFFDCHNKKQLLSGTPWSEVVASVVQSLPDKVYVSFDIDGLSPDLCPGTGTPVPGGLSFEQAVYLLQAVVDAGKTIIGFDLCEVAPLENSEWDANVGARVLYQLCGWTLKSQQHN